MRLGFASLLSVIIALPAGAQSPAAVADSLAFAALAWRELGPHRGGRSVAVAGSVAQRVLHGNDRRRGL